VSDDKLSPRQKLADDVRSHTIKRQTRSLPVLDYRKLALVSRATEEMIALGLDDKLALRHMSTMTIRFGEVTGEDGIVLTSCTIVVDQYGGTTLHTVFETIDEYNLATGPKEP